MKRALMLLLLALALGLAACGDDDESESTPAAEPTQTAEPTPAATADTAKIADGISKDLDTKPEIAKPEGDPPAELVTEDIVRGKGKAAKAGDQVSVQYVGVSWSTGEEFDASWNRNREPFAFALGGGQVIAGWDEGIVGMKEGGRRLLVIPPDKGYGPEGSAPAIGPNETLLFVVDLEQIG